ncbi:hypothetical protein HAX54_034147, partial [Datura stramonium]|nr:hypothetical protein [Datura stramonium]
VRSATRTGRDATSITSGGAILQNQSLKQGSELVQPMTRWDDSWKISGLGTMEEMTA